VVGHEPSGLEVDGHPRVGDVVSLVMIRSRVRVLHKARRVAAVACVVLNGRHACDDGAGRVRVLVGAGAAGRAEVEQHAVRVERRREPMGRSEGRGQLGGAALAPVVL
jgi:hypothetical protein